jgi:hypothetical protein
METDYYLENPERLNGQPKRTIADYVEQNGILVPRRFDTLTEARKSHKGILLRSEHPQDYNGVSNLLDSFELSSKYFGVKGSRDVEEIKQRYFEKVSGKDSCLKDFCQFLELDREEFKQQISFSIWEALGGQNRSIIADSAINGRYHIFTKEDFGNGKMYVNYTILDNGNLVESGPLSLKEGMKEDLERIVEFYESIRSLPNFNPNHCPLVEFQTFENKHYFLQYHRTRDFQEASFSLDRPLEKGEFEAELIRGVTSSEGFIGNISTFYSSLEIKDEEMSIYFPVNRPRMFTEIMAKKRKTQILFENANKIGKKLVDLSHTQKSLMFKPGLFIGHSKLENFITLKENEQMWNCKREKKEIPQIQLRVISDGNRAIIKRI